MPAAGVGIASQSPVFDRISGPASCAPTITGAFDQTSAAALALQPGARLAHRCGHRPLAGGDLRPHDPGEVGPDVEGELHSGRVSSVQTSRSPSCAAQIFEDGRPVGRPLRFRHDPASLDAFVARATAGLAEGDTRR